MMYSDKVGRYSIYYPTAWHSVPPPSDPNIKEFANIAVDSPVAIGPTDVYLTINVLTLVDASCNIDAQGGATSVKEREDAVVVAGVQTRRWIGHRSVPGGSTPASWASTTLATNGGMCVSFNFSSKTQTARDSWLGTSADMLASVTFPRQ